LLRVCGRAAQRIDRPPGRTRRGALDRGEHAAHERLPADARTRAGDVDAFQAGQHPTQTVAHMFDSLHTRNRTPVRTGLSTRRAGPARRRSPDVAGPVSQAASSRASSLLTVTMARGPAPPAWAIR